jgi:membrane-bound lytic murein transglycosylase B
MRKTLLVLLLCFTAAFAKDYTKLETTQHFIDDMVIHENFRFTYLEKLFKNVTPQYGPLRFFTPHKTKPSKALQKRYPLHGAWDRYVRAKLTPSRIRDGIAFIRRYRSVLERAQRRYGVPKEYIAAIIGIESAYGKNTGKYPVFDTLTTLAFEPNRRNRFFRSELKNFIQLCYDAQIDPRRVKGSFAGAIGLGQFMPSNYEAYGVDFNGDGKVSMLHPHDAIASIANYLAKNGWHRGEPVATRVSYDGNRFRKYKTGYTRTYFRHELKGIVPKYGKWNYHGKVRLIKLDRKTHDELWYATRNFRVITRYNHSAYYAMSVHQLACKIAEGCRRKKKHRLHLSKR